LNQLLFRNPPISLVGVASDLGAEARGSGELARLLSASTAHLLEHGVNFNVCPVIHQPFVRSDDEPLSRVYYAEEVRKLGDSVSTRVRDLLHQNRFPLLIGGDHSISIGAVRAAAEVSIETGSKLSVLWIDSHPDMNTFKSSPSGRTHGMALSAILGLENGLTIGQSERRLVDPEDVHVFGVQAVDPLEEQNIIESGVSVTTLTELRARGIETCLTPILQSFTVSKRALYVSIDLDVLDPNECPGVNASCESGLRIEELIQIIATINQTSSIFAADIVEYNRIKDVEERSMYAVLSLLRALTVVSQ
jgi:arginase